MAAISNQTRIARKQDIVSSDVGEELVLMNVERGEYYGFNKVAAQIWRRLAEPVTVVNLVEALAAEYSGDPAAISADVQALLEKMADKGLLEFEA